MLKLKVKKLVTHASLPQQARPGDAGLYLRAIYCYKDNEFGFIEYGTGIAIEVPDGYVGLIFPRSSISKTPHSLANSVGVIDSGYRGEIIFRFRTDIDKEHLEYEIGDRIGQLIIMPVPAIEVVEVEELTETERGKSGYGSTGK